MFFCRILDAFDLEEHPIDTCSHDGKTVTVVLLSPDAYANDIGNQGVATFNVHDTASQLFLDWAMHPARCLIKLGASLHAYQQRKCDIGNGRGKVWVEETARILSRWHPTVHSRVALLVISTDEFIANVKKQLDQSDQFIFGFLA